MRYVRVHRSALRNLPGDLMIWVPMALLMAEERSKEKVVYVYCSLYTFFENPGYVRVLSSFKDVFPGFEEEEPVPTIMLSVEKCSREEFVRSLEKLLADARLLRQSGFEMLSPLRLALSHVFSPARLVLGDIRKVEESIAAQIALRIIEEVSAELFRELSAGQWEEGYVLHTIDLEKGSVYYIIGDRIAENYALSRALRADRVAKEAIGKLSA